MYVRRMILIFALVAGGFYVWHHPSAGRLIGGPEVVVNPHINLEAAIGGDGTTGQPSHDWLIVIGTLGVIGVSVAAIVDRLRRRAKREEEFAAYVPMSVSFGREQAVEELDAATETDAVSYLANGADS